VADMEAPGPRWELRLRAFHLTMANGGSWTANHLAYHREIATVSLVAHKARAAAAGPSRRHTRSPTRLFDRQRALSGWRVVSDRDRRGIPLVPGERSHGFSAKDIPLLNQLGAGQC
jgi:hypothetical protein